MEATGQSYERSWLCPWAPQPGMRLCPIHCTPLWGKVVAFEHLWRNCPSSCHGAGDSQGSLSSRQCSSTRHGAASSPERLLWKNEPLSRDSVQLLAPRGPRALFIFAQEIN